MLYYINILYFVIVSEIEALSSLKAAMDLKVQGRLDRALKLFEHAAALAPKHPDVLTKYGEFLEETKKDIVKADQLYFQVEHTSNYIFFIVNI